MKRIVAVFRGNKKLLLIAIGLMILIFSAIFLAVWGNGRELRRALKSDSERYDKVQVEILQNIQEASDDELATESLGASSSECIIKKYHDIYYQDRYGEETYKYLHDGIWNIQYYKGILGLQQGEWVIEPADARNISWMFDFSVLDEIDIARMHKKDGTYIPDDGYMQELLFAILGQEDGEKTAYIPLNVVLDVEDARLKEIRLEYSYLGYYIETSYHFNYEDAPIDLPVDIE